MLMTKAKFLQLPAHAQNVKGGFAPSQTKDKNIFNELLYLK